MPKNLLRSWTFVLTYSTDALAPCKPSHVSCASPSSSQGKKCPEEHGMVGNRVLWSPGKEPAAQGWDFLQPSTDHHPEAALESQMGQKMLNKVQEAHEARAMQLSA